MTTWKNRATTDHKLCQAASQGQEEAFSELYWHYRPLMGHFYPKVRGYMDYDDFLQEAGHQLFECVNRYQAGEAGQASFYTFYANCLRYLICNIYRHYQTEKRRMPDPSVSINCPVAQLEDQLAAYAHVDHDPQAAYAFHYYLDCFESALSPMERAVLAAYLEGLDWQTIGKELGIGTKSSRTAFYRAKSKLVQLIKENKRDH
ncbi:RNA polymerase sigma factor [Aerococcus sanguinicola]|uniref:RNA polymerase sigma factor n=1 Tax=unclassified Aerococcus TaxID=2618060 RepID=UPI0008A5E314|nr:MULTISPECIES: sigma-70 family RNA polymerase sigma factor [unclassified Aerococcus]KAB0646653.1 sigma-70 family RNA polymerase sigma factor [Aerococcus sanguinicola]MDK6233923.1 sigma-70 family RNA polymerase sigma factor [Aerococcus sp. UMB10185]MDK6805738.1 sigma-70 family RNA polymerase sigma factor [Aerococcus sp. UMB7834]MDK6856360.1 sigma-70 family RNA polymerase sigma factor [Aerococcus sp. UMB7533]MDK8502669.1 sigma-70 family RNA polymerase sigma factor [Aerococcus sp. UMB1112A]